MTETGAEENEIAKTEKEGKESVEMMIAGENTAEMFKNPPAEYRGMPFWAWNCRMTKEKVDAALEAVREMGMGGAFFHCRTRHGSSLFKGRIHGYDALCP